MELQQKIKSKFPYFSDDKLAHLLGLGEFVVLNEGEILVKAGAYTQRVGFVIEGLLRNYIINDQGEQITVVFAPELEGLAPYSSFFEDKPASETTEAVEASVVFVIDHKILMQLAEADLEVARVYMDLIRERLLASIERVEDFTLKNPEQRYKRLLETHSHLIERVPLKYLASYLGITTFSLSRIRKRLAKSRN